MGLISQLTEWIDLQVLTHTDLNAEFAQIINTLTGALGNSNWSDAGEDNLGGAKIDVNTNATFLTEHSSGGVHTAYATNNAEGCRIWAGTSEESQIDIAADQLNLYSSDTLSSRIRKLVQDVDITNLDITQTGDGGGIDTGSETGGEWYFIWVIADSDGENVKGLLSTSDSIAGLSFDNATSYADGYYACIGKIYNDADEDFGNPYGAPGVIVSGTTTDPGKGVAPVEGQNDLTAISANGDQGYAWIGPLLFQWGEDTANSGGSGNAITFPKKFPTRCLVILTGAAGTPGAYTLATNTITQAGFNFFRNSGTASAYWFAVGM